MKHLLGKIFLSHTSADKRFVRRLTNRITGEGFRVWLDERDLLVGDSLPHQISQALRAARVILVIVSKNSIASKWLKYELNVATERMIKGECRVIPVVIDEAPLPPEVVGLLYADCRKSLPTGWRSIATALQYEARRAAHEGSFRTRIEALLRDVFLGTGIVLTDNEYTSKDWDIVQLGISDEFGNDIEPPYDIVLAYGREPRALDEKFWSDYIKETDYRGETLSLIVSERPVGFDVEPISDGLATRSIRDEFIGTSRHVVIADLSRVTDGDAQARILAAARDQLVAFVDVLQGERQQLRERYARMDLEAQGQQNLSFDDRS